MTNESDGKQRRLFIVLNPVAGHYQAEHVRQTFVDVFDEQHICYDIYKTTGREDLGKVVQTAQGKDYSAIVACGGDGTVWEAAGGLLDSDLPLGILPVGTSNLVARELEIPLDLTSACQLLVEQPALTPVDGMQVENKVYLHQLSLGLYAHVKGRVTIEEKRRFGTLAYFWQALQEIARQKSWEFSLSVDNRSEQARASLILLANTGAVGLGDARWGDNIDPHDGVIDVCIVRARSARDHLIALWRLIRRKSQPAEITYLRARKEITVTATKPIPVRLEDETVERNFLKVKVLPSVVEVIVPQKPDWQ